MKPIYMDNNSTTAVDPRVLEAMLPYFTEEFGNAASRTHPWGWRAEEKVEEAREHVARLIGAEPREIVFTSGATESDNMALIGVAAARKSPHLVTTAIEHKAVLDSAKYLETQGCAVTYLAVDKAGIVAVEAVAGSLRAETALVSVMLANNEIGVVQDISAIGARCRASGVFFHSDAAQAAGKVPIDVNAMNVDLLSLSAHKMHGPKGIGALYVRRKNPRVRLQPLIHGGGHERGMRSGTLNVPAIVGFGKACQIANHEMAEESKRLLQLREHLHQRLSSSLEHVQVNGHLTQRLPNNLNVSFGFVEGESLLMALNKEVALSSGSACTSATLEPSYVLRALGVSDDQAHASIRFGLGRFNTQAEVDRVADLVIAAVQRLRAMSPAYARASN